MTFAISQRQIVNRPRGHKKIPSERPSFNLECPDATKAKTNIQQIVPAQKLSTKFILLINVKMPTIVGILTFISMINTTSERL